MNGKRAVAVFIVFGVIVAPVIAHAQGVADQTERRQRFPPPYHSRWRACNISDAVGTAPLSVAAGASQRAPQPAHLG